MSDQTTKFGIFLLALISALLNYAGLSIVSGGNWWLKSLCAMTAIGVWVALYLFWTHAFAAIPDLKRPGKRVTGWITVNAGCGVILALSSYWNLVALAGNEVQRLALLDIASKAEITLARAIDQSSRWMSFAPQLPALSASVQGSIDGETQSGSLSGISGKGSVAETLRQIKAKIDAASEAMKAAEAAIGQLKEKGQTCLGELRAAVSKDIAIDARGDAVAAKVDCINETIAEIGNQDVLSLIRRSMSGLTSGIVVPTSIKSDAQHRAIANVLAGLQKQADEIVGAAAAMDISPTSPLSAERPNIMLAVLFHWRSIIPAIATATALDLLPLLLLILAVLRRRDADEDGDPRHPWTVRELLEAQAQLDRLGQANGLLPSRPVRAIEFHRHDDWWEMPEDEEGGRP